MERATPLIGQELEWHSCQLRNGKGCQQPPSAGRRQARKGSARHTRPHQHISFRRGDSSAMRQCITVILKPLACVFCHRCPMELIHAHNTFLKIRKFNTNTILEYHNFINIHRNFLHKLFSSKLNPTPGSPFLRFYWSI